MKEFKYIKYRVEEKTAEIIINRPEVFNALNFDAKMELIQGIREANKDPEVFSIILRGEGKAFCTGQDLNDRSIQAENGGVDLGHTLITEWNPLVNAIRDSKKIIISAIEGVVAGAGISIALFADLIVAKPGVKFMGAFSKLGLAPDAGSTYLFTRALGSHKTMEFFLLGEPLLSETLYSNGMINALVESPRDQAFIYAKALARLSPLSMQMIKENIKCSFDMSFQESMERETAAQRFLGNSEDYKEGLLAFLNKREPNFKGK